MDDSSDQNNKIKIDQKQGDIKSNDLKTVEINRNFLQNRSSVRAGNKGFPNYKQNSKVYNTNFGKRSTITRRMNMRGKTGK